LSEAGKTGERNFESGDFKKESRKESLILMKRGEITGIREALFSILKENIPGIPLTTAHPKSRFLP
jgi:hypothetical protein